MNYYSTNLQSPQASLEDAVINAVAPDGGLYMPQAVPRLPLAFIRNMANMSLPEIGYAIANFAFQGDVDAAVLHDIVYDTLNFPMPIPQLEPGRFVLELFHGPTMAFKDVGARFMGRLLAYFKQKHNDWPVINVLVPTSGDTGAAVASGFCDVPGVHVYVLYPQDKVSYAQEAQFATLGHNVTAVMVKGTYDDCKNIVEQALLDKSLNSRMQLTTATTINVARLIPQTFYYFYAVAELMRMGEDVSNLVIAVPCANLGNLASGLLARAMGLPVKRFVSVENDNNIFYHYVQTGHFVPHATVASIAPALDAGNPTNFPRVLNLLGSHAEVERVVHAYSYNDHQIVQAIGRFNERYGYIFDPHSAIAYQALCEDIMPGEVGLALATAHPAKFPDAAELVLRHPIGMPAQLARFFRGTRQVTTINSGYTSFRRFLLQ